MHILSYWDAI